MIDLEHGAGDWHTLLQQLQATSATPAAPLVRLRWNEAPSFKRVLDLGAAGVMVPYVCTADEARAAVDAMLYPPDGTRGVAAAVRAADFGRSFETYFKEANEQLLSVVQIETREAVERVEEIAAVARVDVLFVGPTDLSVSLGAPRQFDHPELRVAIERVVAAARKHGKAAGTLAASPGQIEQAVADGFTFIACGSDTVALAQGFDRMVRAVGDIIKSR